MSDKWFWIGMSAMSISMCVGMALINYSESQKDTELAKAGLQQCIEKDGFKTQIVWKKECR